MLPITLIAAMALLMTAPALFAQESQPVEAQPAEAQAPAPPPVRYAVPRSQAPAPARAAEPQRAPEPQRVPIQRAGPVAPPPTAPAVAGAEAADQQRRAIPRGSRPRDDNPPTGIAVPRSGPVRPPDNRGDRGPRIVNRGGRPPAVYNNYYYYPRRSYPYGYGAFGLGYFYYDPFAWSSRNYYSGGVYHGPGYYGSGGYYGGGSYYGQGYAVGYLRLRVSPRHAQVFVDGYYAGVVDDYDGIVQSMTLEDGPYHIEIVAPGFAPLEFDVRILPGQKITYRGDLLPQRP
jgi:hypothetical protein